MSERKRITEKTLEALRPAPAGKRTMILDELSPLAIRSTSTGHHSDVVYRRFRGVPSQRLIARVGTIGLAEARRLASDMAQAAERGEDPLAEARASRASTFGKAMERYIEKRVRPTRKARDAEREIRKELMSRWETLPLADITRRDVIKMMEQIAGRGAERQAHNVFGHARTFFNWCLETDRLPASPCAGIKPARIIGAKAVRTRVLDDTELRAIWAAASETPYPYGPFVRLLLLTGARKSEAADALWPEFDLDAGVWTVPEERFKSGVTHRVPLSREAVGLLTELPKWADSDLVFSHDGRSPMKGHSKSKRRFEKLAGVSGWQIHDLRRTVRTRLASLGVPDTVAEQIIGHGRKGLARVYDQHQYVDEMREALERWAALLRDIVTPPPENVVRLGRRKAS